MPTTDTRPPDHAPAAVPTPVPRAAAPSGSTPAQLRDDDARRTPSIAVLAAILAVVLAAVAVITWVTTRPSADVASDATVTSTSSTEDDALRRLIARGYVPTAAIPPSLYTSQELTTIRLVRAGILPAELLETETFVSKGLVDRGLVPPGSAR